MNQADKPVPDQTALCDAPGYISDMSYGLARGLSRQLWLTILTTLSLLFTAPLSAQIAPDYSRASSAYQSGSYLLAEQLWGQLAVAGDANAQYALGIMHLKREAQSANDKTAFSYFVAAAKQQHIAAIFNLGVAYWEGRGVQRQPAKALNWWEIAAQRQDAGAQYNLGLGYHIGVGREQNEQKALHWIQQAADNGHPQAKSLLSSLKVDDQSAPTLASSDPDQGLNPDQNSNSIPEPDTTAFAPLDSTQAQPAAQSGQENAAEKKAVPTMVGTKINMEPATPVVEEPVVAEPVVAEPIVEEPVAEEPVVEEPIVEIPVVDIAVSKEPVAELPVPPAPVASTIIAETEKPVGAQKKSSTSAHALKTTRLTQLRAAPSASAVSIVSIKANSPVHLLQSAGDWSRVLVTDAFPVWVYETFVLDQGEGKGKIKGSKVNIRPKPSTDNKNSPALGQLNDGDSVGIVLKRAPWVQIIPAQAFPAWIASEDIR